MDPVKKICIIPRTSSLSVPQATSAASAIQEQILKDFYPVWKKSAVITASSSPKIGYTPVFVMDNVAGGLSGYHFTEDGVPYAIVQAGPRWSLAASHEILELLVDPDADMRVHGTTPDGTGSCEYILEVCDPCQDIEFAYAIDGWPVSDFCLPRYFEAGTLPASSAPCSFKKHLASPKQVLPGGTLAWVTPDGRAHQAVFGQAGLQVFDRGPYVPGALPARAFIGQFDRTFAKSLSIQAPPSEVRKNNQVKKERKEKSKELSSMFDKHIKSRILNQK